MRNTEVVQPEIALPRTICEHSRRNAHGRVPTLAVQHEVVTPSPATASDGGAGWARCDVECLVQTWLSRKSAPTGAPLQEHEVGVGRGEPSGVARDQVPGSPEKSASPACDPTFRVSGTRLPRAARLCSLSFFFA